MKIVYQGKTKTGKEIIVRYPEIGDLAELLNFINTLSDEQTFVRYQGEHETLESEKGYLEARLEAIKNKKAVHLLAFIGDKLIGATDIHMLDKTEKHIGILGISVVKDSRGEGVGTLLLDLILQEAKNELAGLKLVTLEVFSSNDIAKKLYSKMGFTEYGMLPGGISRNNSFEDSVLMYIKF